MNLCVRIYFLIYLISQWAINSESASNSSVQFDGLLSDVLVTNGYDNKLTLTSLCNRELNKIQDGLNVKDIWAIKCKLSINLLQSKNSQLCCNSKNLKNIISENIKSIIYIMGI